MDELVDYVPRENAWMPDARWWDENPELAEQQRRHNEAHPGMRCRECPVEVEHRGRVYLLAAMMDGPYDDGKMTKPARLVFYGFWVVLACVLGWFAYDIATWVWGWTSP